MPKLRPTSKQEPKSTTMKETAPKTEIAPYLPPSEFDDGFGVVETGSAGLLRGRRLKFKDNAYLIDGTDHLPEDIKQLTVVSMSTLWTRWEDGKPLHKVTPTGQTHPQREELGDLNQDEWEAGLDGRPADPWRDGRHVHLVHDKTAEQFTFVTETVGGRIAVSNLKSQISLYRRVHPHACPVVELGRADMKTKVGVKQRPAFKVVGWIDPQPAGEPAAPKQLPPAAALSPGDVLNDRIPFAPEVR
jgi:hypothetical protein